MTLGITAGCATTETNSPQVIRVMSYNIHHGRGMDGKVDLERIADVIKREKADIVGLQEVDRGVKRTDGRDLAAELSSLTGMQVYFEKNINFQGGEYGNAILTKFPILSKTNTHYKMLRPGEQRGLLQTVINVNGKKLLFMNTHIDYREQNEERVSNVAEFREIIAREPKLPIILLGDFNDFPNSRVHQIIKEFLVDAWELKGEGEGFTFRSDRPDRRIDYIFFKPERSLELRKIRVIQTQASDHMPLVAEFELR